jgi:hypothetical protein
MDGRGGVTSDWLCMWREGALDPAINIVASLCADVRFFGSALRMGGLAAGFLFLLGADWSHQRTTKPQECRADPTGRGKTGYQLAR